MRTVKLRARPGEGRRRGALSVGLALVLAGALLGCSGGPGEAEMLPDKNLAFPGATEFRRQFDEAGQQENIGGSVDRPARLETYYRVGPETTFDEVGSWYRDQLTKQGWTLVRYAPREPYLEVSRDADGFDHRLIVDRPGGPTNEFEVAYEIRDGS